jgi:protein transport protein SEC31
MKLGKLERTSAIAWSSGQQSSSNILALGTVAGAMDASFSSQSELELYQVEPSSSKLFKKLCSIPTHSRYFIFIYLYKI